MDKTQEFIQKAIKVHGDKYDYSKVKYINARTNIIIICKIHGDFLQVAKYHLSNSGCKKCGIDKKKYSLTAFIERSIIKHNNKYNYSNVNYINAHTNVIIICPIHGQFMQTPNNHYKKGCKACGFKSGAIKNISNTNEFIQKSTQIHKNQYNYSKVDYINANLKVIIICNIHGEFKQRPAQHLLGSGCNKCGTIQASNKTSFNTKDFIIKSNKIHNNKYDYSKVEYINCKLKICIICKIHGEFYNTPDSHIQGSGCNKCGILLSTLKQTHTTDIFINRSNLVHKYKYNYSDVNYITANINVNIICNKHGVFSQRPMTHLLGSGCPKCATNNQFSKSQIQWLEFLEIYYNINIQHMGNSNQEFRIKNTKWKADGYCKETNTIYEYHGSFWHGDPKLYKPDDINNVSKRTMGTLYKRTINREQKIKELGYNLVVMWESDWNKINKSISILQKKFRKCKSLNLLASLV